MYFHNVVGTRSYTTSTTNMYHKDRFHVPSCEEGSSGASSDTGHLHTLGLALLQLNPIGKKKRDRIGHVSHTYKKKMNKILRKIHSTPHVNQACLCITRSILHVTQQVPSMYLYHSINTPRYTTSTTNMYNQDTTRSILHVTQYHQHVQSGHTCNCRRSSGRSRCEIPRNPRCGYCRWVPEHQYHRRKR